MTHSWQIIIFIGMAIASASTPATSQTCSQGPSIRELYQLASEGTKSETTAQLENAITRPLKIIAKIYACQGSVNYFASKTGLPSSIVKEVEVATPDGLEVRFGNQRHAQLCGTIKYVSPSREFAESIPTTPLTDDAAFSRFAAQIESQSIERQGRIATAINTMIGPFLPSGRNYPRPSIMYLRSIIDPFRNDAAQQLRNLITHQKWSPSDTARFIDAWGCARWLFEASPPDTTLLQNYPSAGQVYQDLAVFLDSELGR